MTLTADERTDLAVFMALGAMRTPDIVESLQKMNSGLILEMAKRIYSDVDRVAADLRKDPTYAGKSDEEVRAEAHAMRDMPTTAGLPSRPAKDGPWAWPSRCPSTLRQSLRSNLGDSSSRQ